MTKLRTLLPCLLATTLVGCSKGEHREPPPVEVCPELDAGPVVDRALMAFLSRARAAHHLADLAEEGENPEAAVRALKEFLDGPKPPSKVEAEEVLADTHARLADLQSQLGKFEEANASVSAGMRLAKGTTYYLGHLWEIKGVVAERRAKKLRAEGQEEAARREEKTAVDALWRSMQIQEKVIDELLEPPDDAPAK